MPAKRSTGSPGPGALPGDGPPTSGAPVFDPPAPATDAASLVALGATPRISGRCAWQVVDGEAVLLDLQGKRVLGLNRVGSFVFPLLDGARTVASIAAAMSERFGVDLLQAEQDLRVFLGELSGRGFVEGADR